jgi:hypothetical protein
MTHENTYRDDIYVIVIYRIWILDTKQRLLNSHYPTLYLHVHYNYSENQINIREIDQSDDVCCLMVFNDTFNNIQCLSPLMLWVRISTRARCTTLSDKICQWLATGQWFFLGPPVSSTNKTDHHNITEMLC